MCCRRYPINFLIHWNHANGMLTMKKPQGLYLARVKDSLHITAGLELVPAMKLNLKLFFVASYATTNRAYSLTVRFAHHEAPIPPALAHLLSKCINVCLSVACPRFAPCLTSCAGLANCQSPSAYTHTHTHMHTHTVQTKIPPHTHTLAHYAHTLTCFWAWTYVTKAGLDYMMISL
jgi:hypothetical protein